MQISLVLGAAALLLSARMNVAAYSPGIWPPHFKESLAHNAGAGPAKRTSHFHWPTIPVTMRTTTATPTPTFNPKPEWDRKSIPVDLHLSHADLFLQPAKTSSTPSRSPPTSTHSTRQAPGCTSERGNGSIAATDARVTCTTASRPDIPHGIRR